MSGKSVDFGARVPEQQYERFKSLFPQYGAVTWFINTALDSFLKAASKNPSMQELVDKAVSEMVEKNRERAELQRDIAAALEKGDEGGES